MLHFLSACMVYFSLMINNNTNQPVVIVPEVPILMYHEIGTPDGPWGNLYVSKENFEAQVKYLKENNFTTITISELQANRNGERNLPKNPIVLTFDDGYASTYEFIYPLLRENHMTGVFYVIPKKFNTYNSLASEQIKEMSDNGMEIGSHSMNHINMTSLSSKQLAYELKESKRILEEITEKPILSFCYPAGRYSNAIIEHLINEGYENAVTTKQGFVNINQSNYELKRIRINYEDSLYSFSRKININ